MKDLFVFYAGLKKDALDTIYVRDNCCLYLYKDDIDDFIKEFISSNKENKKTEISYFTFKKGLKILPKDSTSKIVDRSIKACRGDDDFDLIIIKCQRYQENGECYDINHRIVRYRDYTTVDKNEIRQIIT